MSFLSFLWHWKEPLYVCRISLRMRSFHHGWVHTQFFHETHNLNQPDFLKHHYMTSIASARNFNNGGIIRCNWKCTFKVLARFFRLDLNLWKLNKPRFWVLNVTVKTDFPTIQILLDLVQITYSVLFSYLLRLSNFCIARGTYDIFCGSGGG